jgi:hypothetical protein
MVKLTNLSDVGESFVHIDKSSQIKTKSIIGPFNADVGKMYKPIFLVFVDMILGISITVFSMLYYWIELDDKEYKDIKNVNAINNNGNLDDD